MPGLEPDVATSPLAVSKVLARMLSTTPCRGFAPWQVAGHHSTALAGVPQVASGRFRAGCLDHVDEVQALS